MISLDFLNDGSRERRKKKSIRGVLSKNDLAEVYNCEKRDKLGKPRRKSKGETTAPALPAVKAVEFQEAVLEDILALENGGSVSERKLSRDEASIVSAVRRISQANLLVTAETNNNNNSVYKTDVRPAVPSRPQRLEAQASAGSEAAVGYEPENALRRISVTGRLGFTREKAVRRKSALDRPNLTIFESAILETAPPPPPPDYEPENALRRVRKSSAETVAGAGNRRQRKTGLSLVMTNGSSESAQRDSGSETPCNHNDSPANSVADAGQSASPKTAHKQRALFSLSIPEDGGGITTALPAPSPRATRRTSLGRLHPATPSSGLEPPSATGSPKIPRNSSTPALRHSLSARSDGSHSSTRSAGSADSVRVSAAAARRHGGSHINANRYWDWYVLNASYSWSGFNNDKYLGY